MDTYLIITLGLLVWYPLELLGVNVFEQLQGSLRLVLLLDGRVSVGGA